MTVLNLWVAWIGILLGLASGTIQGLFFDREDWLGGYGSWPRRLMRLGHISFQPKNGNSATESHGRIKRYAFRSRHPEDGALRHEVCLKFPCLSVCFRGQLRYFGSESSTSRTRRFRWFTETDLPIHEDGELLRLMRGADCVEVLIGFESPVAQGLDGLELKRNWKHQRYGQYRRAIECVQAAGISHGATTPSASRPPLLGKEGRSPRPLRVHPSLERRGKILPSSDEEGWCG